jgi:MOSC domain-containing protein YiiM
VQETVAADSAKTQEARLVSIQVSLPRRISAEEAPDPNGQAWTTGFFKQPVEGPVWLGRTNLAGDGQGDRRNHGGPDKAVLAYAAAHYPAWRAELGRPELPHGAFAENFAVAGLDEETVCIGDVYTMGTARVQVSQPRQPCWKIAARWRMPELTALVERSGRTGWYLRVLEEGTVAPGDALTLVERPFPEWSVARATAVMRRRDDVAGAEALDACPLLAASWHAVLSARVAKAAAGHGMASS